MSSCAASLDIVVQAPIVVDINLSAPVMLDIALAGIQGPRGSQGAADITGGDGIAVFGNDIRINIEELPLAPGA